MKTRAIIINQLTAVLCPSRKLKQHFKTRVKEKLKEIIIRINTKRNKEEKGTNFPLPEI